MASATYPDLFIFSGPDHLRRSDALSRAIAAALDPAMAAFNLDRLSGRGLAPAALATAITTPPLMAETRVVVVDDAGELSKDALAVLVAEVDQLIARDAKDLRLLVVYPGEGTPAKDLVTRAGRHETFAEMKRGDAVSWAASRARDLGLPFDRNAADALVRAVGTDAGRLANEIKKLGDYANGERITADMIAEVTGSRPNESVYDLCDAVGLRDFPRARLLLTRVLQDPEFNGVRISITLARHLSNVGRALARRREPPASVSRMFGWTGEKIVAQAKRWDEGSLDNALDALADVDTALKSGGEDLGELSYFLVRALVPREAPTVDPNQQELL